MLGRAIEGGPGLNVDFTPLREGLSLWLLLLDVTVFRAATIFDAGGGADAVVDEINADFMSFCNESGSLVDDLSAVRLETLASPSETIDKYDFGSPNSNGHSHCVTSVLVLK